jgi:hypothetical protein
MEHLGSEILELEKLILHSANLQSEEQTKITCKKRDSKVECAKTRKESSKNENLRQLIDDSIIVNLEPAVVVWTFELDLKA